MFTEKEVAYLKSQMLARLATVSDAGQPDAVAVGFEFDGRHFYIGGYDLPATRKYKNIAAGHARAFEPPPPRPPAPVKDVKPRRVKSPS